MLNQSVLFLTLGGRELYSLMKNLAFPIVPAELPFEKLKSLLLYHILPVDFQAKFNSVMKAANMPCCDFILQLNEKASKCNYGDRLEEQLCDRLFAGINNISSQRKMLEKKDITFDEARKICEQSDDLCAATNADTPVLFHRQSTKPLRDAPSVHNSPPVPQVPSSSQTQLKAANNRCLSCSEYHLRSTCRFRNATCHAFGNPASVTTCQARPGTASCRPITVQEAQPMVHRANMTFELVHVMRRCKRLRYRTTVLQPIIWPITFYKTYSNSINKHKHLLLSIPHVFHLYPQFGLEQIQYGFSYSYIQYYSD
ncbi:unnamed protein product [Echinostoma caproni]|uniref:FAS1 domain-containing protein n=1 Tax=Echinostoma caproni TaxID=27848 RepID=A0A183A8B7_9TREM|nr:unnamed protein product [Echinostoma caproni]